MQRRRGPSDSYGQACPIAAALDVVGDRWTLLILRDLAHAPLRFSDLQDVNPRLSPNVLTQRLRDLERAGLVVRRELPRPARAAVYALADGVRDVLLPILNAVGRFGAYLADRGAPLPATTLIEQLRRNATWVLAKGIDATGEFVVDFGGTVVGIRVAPATFEPAAELPPDPIATITMKGATMPMLANAGLTVADAEASGALTIDGDRAAAIALLSSLCLADLDLAGSTR